MSNKYWKLVKDPSSDPKLHLYHYELVPVEREYCNGCKVLIVEGHCFCEWEENNEPGDNQTLTR